MWPLKGALKMNQQIQKKISIPSSITVRLSKSNKDYVNDLIYLNHLTSINQGINKAIEQARLIENIDDYLNEYESIPNDIKGIKLATNVVLELICEICSKIGVKDMILGTEWPIYNKAVNLYHQNAKSKRLKKLKEN